MAAKQLTHPRKEFLKLPTLPFFRNLFWHCIEIIQGRDRSFWFQMQETLLKLAEVKKEN